MYKTVIFDVDCTLLNSVEDIRASLNRSLRLFDRAEHTYDEVRSYLGYGARRLIEQALPDGRSDPHYDEIFTAYMADYSRNCAVLTKPYDGITEALDVLRERGIRLGALSNKSDAEVKLLVEKWFPGYFGAVAGMVDGRQGKPATDGLFAVMDAIGAEKDSSVYVGDAETDILTAKNGGLESISVCWGARSREHLAAHGAARLAETPEEMLAMILGG